ncbi:hypothetical protein EYC80_007985 [Monilinia laxa]|uniref:histone deacetylase n=1 Tax=Monilinia laxa TaxID=61186 RepID=A0A5N6JT42_MONLA|nr:hypothetical protein EYC80_007985 [Monilinia laxa]
METLGPPLLLGDSDLDMSLHENSQVAPINGTLSNGNGFVDPRVLTSTETAHLTYDEQNYDDDNYMSSSYEDMKIIATPRQAYLPTGCCYDDRMKLHASGDFSDNGPHPEDPRRIESIMRTFKLAGLLYTGGAEKLGKILEEAPSKYMWRIAAREARKDEICTLHTSMHYEWVKSLAYKTSEQLREMNISMDVGRTSLYVGLCTYEAALISAGGAIETCKHVVEGTVRNAIAVIRPPGHHAEADAALGFCIFNNVPIAAKICLLDYPEKCKKILIVDWDIHHGNGTQNMFYDDPNVLYISIHVYDNGNFYPGQPEDRSIPDGGNDKVGRGAGLGKNVNIGWHSQGMGDGEYMAAFQEVIMPIAQEYDPDLVIISAGFDAAAGDELGGCFVSPACYSQMTHMLMSLADGKVAVCLEGGYNLSAISRSALAVAKTLMGEPPIRLPIPSINTKAATVLQEVRFYQSPYWECMRSGMFSYKEAQFKGAVRVDDVVRDYQRNVLSKNHRMVSLWIQRHQLARTFDNQVMVTPMINFAKKVLIIIHDPAELLAAPDPLTAQVSTHNAYVVDPVLGYIEWAVANEIGVMDINIPWNSEPLVSATGSYPPRSTGFELENEIKDLVCYIWDNFIDLYASDNILLMGAGDAYLAVKQLLTSRDCRHRIAGVLAFITGSLRPVKSETDSGLSSWYKSNSEIYVAGNHACWTDEENIRKVKKQRFGNVVQSEEKSLVRMLRRHELRAKEWMLEKFEEKTREDFVMTIGDENAAPDEVFIKKSLGILSFPRYLPIIRQALENAYGPIPSLVKLVISDESTKAKSVIGTGIRRDNTLDRILKVSDEPSLPSHLLVKMVKFGRVASRWVEIFPQFRWRVDYQNRRFLRPHEQRRLRQAIYNYWIYSNLFHDDIYTNFNPDLPSDPDSQHATMFMNFMPSPPPENGDHRLRLIQSFTTIEIVQLKEFLQHVVKLIEIDLYPSDSTIQAQHNFTSQAVEKIAWGDGAQYRDLVRDLLKYNPVDLVYLYDQTFTKSERAEYMCARELGSNHTPATLGQAILCITEKRRRDELESHDFSYSHPHVKHHFHQVMYQSHDSCVQGENLKFGIADHPDGESYSEDHPFNNDDKIVFSDDI